MPIYEYACPECSTDFERLVRTRNGEENNVECPECGNERVDRKISLFARTGSNSSGSGSSCGSCSASSCAGCG